LQRARQRDARAQCALVTPATRVLASDVALSPSAAPVRFADTPARPLNGLAGETCAEALARTSSPLARVLHGTSLAGIAVPAHAGERPLRNWGIRKWAVAAATALAAATARGEDGLGALEVTVGFGYDQGFGAVGDGIPRLQDTGSAGGATALEIGWRIEPRFTFGVYGSGSAHAAGRAVPSGKRAYAAAAGFMTSYHARPSASLDPWMSAGIGWRGYWVGGERGTDVLAGLDLLRIQVGVGYAVSDRTSVSPVLGVSLTRFESMKAAGEGSYRDIGGSRTAAFVFGGVLGRFEVLGNGPAHPERVSGQPAAR
jgi:hypothetical protein